MTFALVLAESALELMPRELQREPAIRREAREIGIPPERMLLDASHHLASMRKRLGDWERRGRPDLVHFCTLLALDSRLNKEQGIRIFVHTRNDEVIEFASDLRFPRAYARFYGLMQDLFTKGRITSPDGKVLMAVRKQKLKELMADLAKTHSLYALDVNGRRAGISQIATEIAGKDACFIIGGFPHGAFAEKQVLKLPAFSISDKELCAWAVLLDVLAACELASEGKK